MAIGSGDALNTSVKIDAYRLAWLPIVFLAEQDESSEPFSLIAGIDSDYRDVITSSLWIYMLHNYLGLVRRSFGRETERLVRQHQKTIFSEENPEAGDTVEFALGLIDDALRVGVVGIPFNKTRFEVPAELRVALALLIGLPESPGYMEKPGAGGKGVVHKMNGIDWRLSYILASGRRKVSKTFCPVFEKIDPITEPLWSH